MSNRAVSKVRAAKPIPVDADRGQPLYVQIASNLGERISDGTFPVGDLLPTEAELSKQFEVSRFTVRQAIQHLRQQGLVSARKGVGTRVETSRGEKAYTQSLHSLSEILQYAIETRLEVESVKEVAVRGAIAEKLGCRSGKRWLLIKGTRYAPDDDKPICLSEVYVDLGYKSLARLIGTRQMAICALIEEQFGETIEEVEQFIEAVILSQAEADAVGTQEGSPALRITRRFFATGRRMVELSINLHPAERFAYAMTLKRDVGNLPGTPRDNT